MFFLPSSAALVASPFVFVCCFVSLSFPFFLPFSPSSSGFCSIFYFRSYSLSLSLSALFCKCHHMPFVISQLCFYVRICVSCVLLFCFLTKLPCCSVFSVSVSLYLPLPKFHHFWSGM